MPKKVTMQEIANHLNISKNSVSQALTNKPGVSEATRTLIKTTAKEMGYTYPLIRHSNSTHEMKNIGLFASNFAFSQKNFFGEIYLSIERELKKRNMNLLIQSIDQETSENLVLPSLIENKSISGILILSHLNTEYINRIINTGITTVMIDHHHPFNFADAILVNNRFAAYKAVQHLIDSGHTNIGFMGDINFSPSYQERLEGYLLALKDNSLEVNNNNMITRVEESRENVSEKMEQLYQQPTAWFCVNDGFGFFVLTYLQSNGFQIPNDISVCSFDNGELSRLSTPKITTMHVDLTLYGKKAVEQLLWRMDHPDDELQEILINSNLIKRESVGPPPSM